MRVLTVRQPRYMDDSRLLRVTPMPFCQIQGGRPCARDIASFLARRQRRGEIGAYRYYRRMWSARIMVNLEVSA